MSMYLQPSTREELISALGQLTDKSRIIAGGTDLMPDLRKKRPDVDIFLYKDDMHEVLNETDREDVYRDVIGWLDKRAEAR